MSAVKLVQSISESRAEVLSCYTAAHALIAIGDLATAKQHASSMFTQVIEAALRARDGP